MAISYESLRDSPKVFKSLTGLTLQEFEALANLLVPRLREFDQLRHAGPGRRRSMGGGRRYNLSPRTRIMLNVGDPDSAFRLAMLPCDGIGLARMEFIFASWVGVHPLALTRHAQLPPTVRRAFPSCPFRRPFRI